jgi:hypothetical protein
VRFIAKEVQGERFITKKFHSPPLLQERGQGVRSIAKEVQRIKCVAGEVPGGEVHHKRCSMCKLLQERAENGDAYLFFIFFLRN